MNNTINEAEKITNLDYLVDLSKGNKLFVKEMIVIFLSENPEEIKTIEKGIAEKDYDLIKATAHKLRSTIPFIGLDKLIESEVEEMETLATNHANIKEIEKRFSRIKETCEKACIELQPV
ncbi:MAG TPA: Hpt domain-containing protein [Bacteroidia bacterium]|jgi:HPt (histidine-containing phosphotransfer) domain-containing protein|nr:Hpt domain-containing protein [Bacteroidia bacterium]